MLVRECLRTAPVTVPPECSVHEAADLMRTHGVGSLLVLSGGRLVGILTDRDIVVRCVGFRRSCDESVESCMTPDPVVIQGSLDILEAMKTLRNIEARRLPVLEDGELAGIVTVDDLLVALVVELGAVASPVAKELSRPQG